ncbi:C-type lectin domain family 4 member E-like [Alosa alosa]|uniref:C-type lectin domain family 4 member E-like n=1 Tax=Alosa alosa TaxID=278164 RepID=UPI0020154C50|nr:C-type lectin domain family 4 member E-like [Alosa alosa]
MDLLQVTNNNLTQEKDRFQERNTNLTKERDQLTTTWSDGKQHCMDLGGHLVIIDSEEEQVFMAGIQKRGWIGLTDVEGTWKWLDGKLLETGYWNEGEPNNFKGNVHCVEILHSATSLKNWNDNIYLSGLRSGAALEQSFE